MHDAFSTRQIDQNQRLAFWADAICQTFLTVDCRRQGVVPIHGEMKGCRLGVLDLIDVISPAMEYYRGPSELKGHTEEHFQLVLQVSGTGFLRQNDKQAILMPGDTALYSASVPSSIEYTQGSRTLAVKIPRRCVLERISGDVDAMSISLKAGAPLGSMVGGLIKESFAWGFECGASENARLVNGVLDIVAFAFDARPECSMGSLRKNPLEQIKRHMRSHLGDPELLLVDVASKHNVSIRTLNRLFAAEGTSANRWLWLQRLEASYKALSEGTVRQVSEAALACGFNDLSHFSKAFKKAYGVTPNQLLKSSGR